MTTSQYGPHLEELDDVLEVFQAAVRNFANIMLPSFELATTAIESWVETLPFDDYWRKRLYE